MADKIINDKLEFIYSEKNCLVKLNEVLEERFCYQRVLVVCDSSLSMIKIKEGLNSKKYLLDLSPVSKIDYEKEYDCYVVVGSDDCINRVKSLAFLKKTPYIILARVNNSFVIFNKKAYTKVLSKQVNYPLGIIFDMDNLYYRCNEFICEKTMEIVSLEECKLECIINKHIFESAQNYSFCDTINNFVARVVDIKKVYAQDVFRAVDEMLSCFIDVGLFLSGYQDCEIVEVMANHLKSERKLCFSQVMFISAQIITNIYLKFIENYRYNCSQPVNLEVHEQVLNRYKLNYNQEEIYESKKFNFVLKNYKEQLKECVVRAQSVYEKVIDLCKYYSLNYLYNYSGNLSDKNYNNALCLASDVYKGQSLLKVINSYGFLSYN